MNISFAKYHALSNDFIVIESSVPIKSRAKLGQRARKVCDRKTGVGADGLLLVSPSRKADRKIDVYNADGSWAEKSGNGLRIAGVHLYLKQCRQKHKCFEFETANSTDTVSIGKRIPRGFMVSAKLDRPCFETSLVPVRTKQRFMINAPLKIGGVNIPITCLSVGNPHAVLVVSDFNFDWQTLGAEIETHRAFPNRTNVEFVKIVNRGKIWVADWERGAGATGSSGTGAAASVCAGIIMGLLDRKCEVVFETGSLFIEWPEDNSVIQLTGPVEHICDGTFNFK